MFSPLLIQCSLPQVMLFTFTDFHIFTVIFIYSSLHGFTWNQNCDQLLVGFLAQLVEHSTGIVEVMCSNPVQDRTEFFSVLILQSKEDRFHIHVVCLLRFHKDCTIFYLSVGKISAQPHTTLCIQLLDRENNDKNNTLPLGKQICFTIVWGCVEILPLVSSKK